MGVNSGTHDAHETVSSLTTYSGGVMYIPIGLLLILLIILFVMYA